MSENTAFIYMLTDPFPGSEICYIGQTKHPENRFRAHLCDPPNKLMRNWIKILRLQGKMPIMNILLECTRKEAKQAEIDAIAIVKAIRGASCLNYSPRRIPYIKPNRINPLV